MRTLPRPQGPRAISAIGQDSSPSAESAQRYNPGQGSGSGLRAHSRATLILEPAPRRRCASSERSNWCWEGGAGWGGPVPVPARTHSPAVSHQTRTLHRTAPVVPRGVFLLEVLPIRGMLGSKEGNIG